MEVARKIVYVVSMTVIVDSIWSEEVTCRDRRRRQQLMLQDTSRIEVGDTSGRCSSEADGTRPDNYAIFLLVLCVVRRTRKRTEHSDNTAIRTMHEFEAQFHP